MKIEEMYNFVPLLAPVDNVAAETKTAYIDLAQAQEAYFFVQNGLLTSATATDLATITVEAATAPTAAEAAIAYNYQKASAAGANTWGDLTASDATGVELDPAADDGKALLIDVNPEWVNSKKADARYVRVSIGTAADMAAHLTSVYAIIKPRYKQATMNSATAAASA